MSGNEPKMSRAERKAERQRLKAEREANRSTGAKIVRSILIPSMPWKSPVRSLQTGMDLMGEASMLKRGLKRARRICPDCGARVTVGDIIPQDGDGNSTGQPYRAFMCQSCGYHESVAEAIAEAKASVDGLKAAEQQLFYAGIGIMVIFSAIALWGSNIAPLLGGCIIAFSLISAALLYRYRHWQVLNDKLFLDKPPLKEWLRDEMAK